MSTNKEILQAFRNAFQFLDDGSCPLTKDRYICRAIRSGQGVQARAGDAAIHVVEARLGQYETLGQWLRAHNSYVDYAHTQKLRHIWLQEFIAEYEAKVASEEVICT